MLVASEMLRNRYYENTNEMQNTRSYSAAIENYPAVHLTAVTQHGFITTNITITGFQVPEYYNLCFKINT